MNTFINIPPAPGIRSTVFPVIEPTHKPIFCEHKGDSNHLTKAKFLMWAQLRGVLGTDPIQVISKHGVMGEAIAGQYLALLDQEQKEEWLAS